METFVLPTAEKISSWIASGVSVDDITTRLAGIVEPTLKSRFPYITKDALLNGLGQLHRTIGLWAKDHVVDVDELCQRIQAYHVLVVYENLKMNSLTMGAGRTVWISKKNRPLPNHAQRTAFELGLYTQKQKSEQEIREQVDLENPTLSEDGKTNLAWRIQNSWNYFVTDSEHAQATVKLFPLLAWALQVFEKTVSIEQSERDIVDCIMANPEHRKLPKNGSLSVVLEVQHFGKSMPAEILEMSTFTEHEVAALVHPTSRIERFERKITRVIGG